jgi:hypothetical protein
MRDTLTLTVRSLLIAAFSSFAFVTSCSERKSSESTASVVEKEPEDFPDDDVDLSETEMLDTFTERGDSITIPEFEIEVDLTDDAEILLERTGETIIVQAFIMGVPKDDAKVEVTKMGEVYLADPNIELHDTRVARFREINIAKKSFESLAEEDFEVLINIFSGRHSSDVNVLDCDILQEPISVVRGQRHILSGKLIESIN